MAGGPVERMPPAYAQEAGRRYLADIRQREVVRRYLAEVKRSRRRVFAGVLAYMLVRRLSQRG